jgi:predicted RNA-binding Zn ribbon-like protein
MAIRKDFGFIGRLCLDFAQTGDMGWGTRYERLTSPSELARWIALSPFGFPRVRITSGDLNAAKSLRGAIWRVAFAIVESARPPAADIRLLNRLACGPALVRKLDAAAKSVSWNRPTIDGVLTTIAQDAVMLFGDSVQRRRMRHCDNPRCRVIFYDDSRPGTRRWCAPNRCGDRIRAKAYRERRSGKR